MTFSKSRATLSVLIFTCLLPIGCGLGNATSSLPISTSPSPSAAPTGVIQGKVHGGNSPITGATVQLYAAGQSATGATGAVGTASGSTPGTPGVYGTNYTPLITSSNGTTTDVGGMPYPILTDGNGEFSITGTYNCPATTPDSQVYLVATAGNPGLTSGTNNLAAVTIAALGSCTTLKANAATTYIQMNEVTTAATIWALQQFMSASFGASNMAATSGSGTNGSINFGIGAPSTNIVGLDNAFATAQILANNAAGSSPGTSAIATVESAKINTLADILSVCINAVGSSDAMCGDLEAAATPGSSTTAADALQIGLYIARNPANNVSALFGYAAGSPPFVGLSSAPTDWTVGIQYAPQNAGANALGGAFGIAADKYGNVWLSQAGNGTAPAASVVELGPTGTLLLGPVTSFSATNAAGLGYVLTTPPAAGTVTFSSPRSIAIDSSNNMWVGNGSTITTSTTTNTSGPGFASGAAVTKVGTVFRFTGSTASGTAASGALTGYFSAPAPYGAAADGTGNIYFISNDSTTGNAVSKITMEIGTYNSTANSYAQSNTGSTTVETTGTSAFSITIDQNQNATFTGAPTLWALGGGSCTPYGNITDIQTAKADPLDETLGNVTYGSTGSPSGTLNTTNSNLDCGYTVNQRFLAPVQTMYGIAADALSNLWVTDHATSADVDTAVSPTYTDSTYNAMTYLVQKLTSATIGNSSTGSASTNFANLSAPTFIAVDGSNHAWVVNSSTLTTGGTTGNCSTATPCNSIAEFSSTVTGPTITNLAGTYGFVHTFYSPANLTIDLSGNVWVANSGTTANYVTVIVGAATPVLPPAYAIANQMLGLAP
jgi:hypothetical protein